MIVIALLIRRDGGPALFAQARVGQNGKSFQCLKFRTMVENAPDKLDDYFRINPEAQQEWTQTQKLKNDPRITQHGLFIRAWSLDELPQLFNVLKGEMSLVGPRPMEFGQIPLSGDDLQFYLMAKPGITGLWQVSGRSHLTFEERVHLGTWYVKNWSLWLDIVILSRTIPTVLTKRGAY
jgi:undecaprenyl-phosphate galactose phosphotransferase